MLQRNSIKIGLIQMHCEKAAIADNLEKIASYLNEAVSFGVDILSFPEMSITGYVAPANYPQTILRLDGPEVEQLDKITRGKSITILAGLIEENPVGKPFVTHVVVRDGKLLGFYRKNRIVDEEVVWFSPGRSVPIFKHDDLPFGIAICADIGSQEVFSKCARQGAKIVFEVAAPGLYGDQESRNWKEGYQWWESRCKNKLSRYAKDYCIWITVSTQAGRTTDEDFPGGGYVFAPDGNRVYATSDWTPKTVHLKLNLKNNHVTQL